MVQASPAGITAIVITRNEARHIRPCLESLAWADARLVLDSLSSDRTQALAADQATVRERPFDTEKNTRLFAEANARYAEG